MYTVPSIRNRVRINSRRGPGWHRHPFHLHLLPDREVDTDEQVKRTRRVENARKVIPRRADAAATAARDNSRVPILHIGRRVDGLASHVGLGEVHDDCEVELKSRRPINNALKRRLFALPPLPATGGVLEPVPVRQCDVVSTTDDAAVLVMPPMESDEVLPSEVAYVLCEMEVPWRRVQACR